MTHKPERLGELDLCFMVDETGSMGPYIQTVKQKILEIIHNIRSKELCSSLRIATVSYRDHPPEDNSFVTNVFKFNNNSDEIKKHILGMYASGGGDGPEAVSDGLYDVNRLYWREKAAKIVIWMGDAPPHGVKGEQGDNFKKGCPDGKKWEEEAEYAYKRGILIYSVGCYPAIKSFKTAEKVFKEIAQKTNGKFVPLQEAHLLVSLITGVAESELEKLKVEELVAQEMQKVMAASPSMSEKEMEEVVYSKLEASGVTLKDLGMAPSASAPVEEDDLKLKKRKVKKSDIKEAMRQAKLKKLV